MSRRFLLTLLLAATVLALVAATVPAVAQDEWGDEGDGEQLEGDEGDTTGAGEDEEPRHGIGDGDPSQFINAPGTVGGAGGAFSETDQRKFHPIYKLDHKRDQDVSSWTHNFVMNYPASDRILFTANTNINTRGNDAANRLNRQETWAAGLSVKVSDAIGTGIDFRRTRQLDIQNEGKSNETQSERERESVKLRTSYEKRFTNGIDVALGANAGIEKNDYVNITSRGATQGITGRLNYSPLEGLITTFNYSGNHSILDSEQGALASTDESFDHDLSGRVDYKWYGHSFTIDMRRSTGQKEYPKNEQTEFKEQDSESTNITANVNLLEGLTTRIGVRYARDEQYYRVEPSRNSDVATRGVEAHLTYDLGETSFKADLGADKKRNDYFDVQTNDNYTKSFNASLSHTFSDRFDATVRARTNLVSVHYDDVIENDQDRDLFDQEVSLSANYKMRDDITTGLEVKVREDQLIYIRTTRTGDNKTTQKYSIEPSIRKTFTPRVSASQRYTLSADYTFYTYDEDSNFLIRNMTITTGVSWKPFSPLDLSIEHTFRAQDEGSYVKDEQGVEGYGRNSERSDQSLGFTVRYRIADLISIEVKQTLGVQDKWRINEDGSRTRVWDKYDTSILGKASTEYSLDDGTKLTASIARTLRDATSISERQREVWNIAVTLDRTF